MKKCLAFITALILLLCFALPCSAQTLTAIGNADGGIFAKYTDELIGCYTCKTLGGGASVTTGGGITLTVKGALRDGLTLVVMPVLQSDIMAWSWFESMMDGKAEKFMPFDIYFTDESGNPSAPASDIEVALTIPEGYAKPLIYNLFPDETLNEPDSAAAGEALSFIWPGR